MQRSFSKNSYVHVTKRGVRGLPISKDEHDKWKFLRRLRYFNNEIGHKNWHRQVIRVGAEGHKMPWPEDWPEQKRLVNIHAYTLMTNHFHLLLEEINDGGIAKFMKKISESMTKAFNKKYKTQGSLFQGPYKSSVVDSDEYLKFLTVYILVKNPFELYPAGFQAACDNFDKALEWASAYSFSSLATHLGKRKSAIIDPRPLSKFFADRGDFKQVAKEALQYSSVKKLEGGRIHLE